MYLHKEVAKIGFNIKGVKNDNIYYLPLSEVLDGTDTNYYISCCELSIQGGDKMGQFFVEIISSDIKNS